MYESIRKNKQKTTLLVGLFTVIIILVCSLVGYLYYDSPLIGGVLGGTMGVVYTYFSVSSASKRLIKLAKGKKIDKSTTDDIKEVQALNIVQQLAMMANIPEPELYVIEDDLPNAFASGMSPDKAVVAVTSGLLERLNRSEIEGVIAHEIAHIQNYDSRLKMTVFAMGGFLILFGQIMMRLAYSVTHSNRKGAIAAGAWTTIAVGAFVFVLGTFLSKIMQLWVSRNREYLADATAVELTRNPQALISALAKISDMDASDVAESSIESLYFVHPLKKDRDSIWSTHPSMDNRIKRLNEV